MISSEVIDKNKLLSLDYKSMADLKNQVYPIILSKVKNIDIADEIFQETLFKAIVNIRSNKNYIEGGKLKSWLLKIAENLIIDHFRELKKTNLLSISSYGDKDFEVIDPDKNVEEILVDDEKIKELISILKLLPEHQQEIIKLRFYNQLSFKEIAEQTDSNINTALGRIRYAILNIKKHLRV